jgi:hypothetical protein
MRIAAGFPGVACANRLVETPEKKSISRDLVPMESMA